MKCAKCKNNTFYIKEINCCDDCSENEAWNAEIGEYISDEKIIHEKELVRNYVDENGECNICDYASGNGCHMLTCCKCGEKWCIPTGGEC
jgi:hypothetical protein